MRIFKDEREKKFTSIYSSYVDEIYQYVYLRSGLSTAEAEDLTQDIFLAVYNGLSSFKGLSSERTWIYKITRNKLNDFYRKKYSPKFEVTEIDSEPVITLSDPSQDIDEITFKSVENESIRRCLDSLPEQYKIVIILKYIDDKSVKDISFIVGKSPKAVESVLQRAKQAFIKNYNQSNEKEDM